MADMRRVAYDRLPRVKITGLLLEVDSWTGFSECFTHRRSGRMADDRNAILTDGTNLGLTRMAETCQGATLHQLAHLHDWHISEAAYGEALGRLIDVHRTVPLAALWGDGQLFHAGRAWCRDRRYQRTQRERTRRQLLHSCVGPI